MEGITTFNQEETNVDKFGWITKWPNIDGSMNSIHQIHDSKCKWIKIEPYYSDNKCLAIIADDDKIHQWVMPYMFIKDLPDKFRTWLKIAVYGSLRIDKGKSVVLKWYPTDNFQNGGKDYEIILTVPADKKFHKFKAVFPVSYDFDRYTFGFAVQGPSEIYIDDLYFDMP